MSWVRFPGPDTGRIIFHICTVWKDLKWIQKKSWMGFEPFNKYVNLYAIVICRARPFSRTSRRGSSWARRASCCRAWARVPSATTPAGPSTRKVPARATPSRWRSCVSTSWWLAFATPAGPIRSRNQQYHGQSYKASTSVIYESRVVITIKLLKYIYDSRDVNYDRREFIRLTTDVTELIFSSCFRNELSHFPSLFRSLLLQLSTWVISCHILRHWF